MTINWSIDPVTAAIAGNDDRFPVRRIYCVGKNYDAHAAEMGWTGTREPPFFFTKFADVLTPSGGTRPYPPRTQDYHYEGELVVALAKPLWRASANAVLDAVWGYGAGLDMTRRDLQFAARDKGRPWDLGKNFDGAAVLAPLHPVRKVGHLDGAEIAVTVNGETRQHAPLTDMIWTVAEILADLSHFGELAPGDLIYTGTPAGVGAVRPGDHVGVTVTGLSPCTLTIGEAR